MSCEWGMGWKWVVTGNVNAKRKDRLAPVPIKVWVTIFSIQCDCSKYGLVRLDLSHNHEV